MAFGRGSVGTDVSFGPGNRREGSAVPSPCGCGMAGRDARRWHLAEIRQERTAPEQVPPDHAADVIRRGAEDDLATAKVTRMFRRRIPDSEITLMHRGSELSEVGWHNHLKTRNDLRVAGEGPAAAGRQKASWRAARESRAGKQGRCGQPGILRAPGEPASRDVAGSLGYCGRRGNRQAGTLRAAWDVAGAGGTGSLGRCGQSGGVTGSRGNRQAGGNSGGTR